MPGGLGRSGPLHERLRGDQGQRGDPGPGRLPARGHPAQRLPAVDRHRRFPDGPDPALQCPLLPGQGGRLPARHLSRRHPGARREEGVRAGRPPGRGRDRVHASPHRSRPGGRHQPGPDRPLRERLHGRSGGRPRRRHLPHRQSPVDRDRGTRRLRRTVLPDRGYRGVRTGGLRGAAQERPGNPLRFLSRGLPALHAGRPDFRRREHGGRFWESTARPAPSSTTMSSSAAWTTPSQRTGARSSSPPELARRAARARFGYNRPHGHRPRFGLAPAPGAHGPGRTGVPRLPDRRRRGRDLRKRPPEVRDRRRRPEGQARGRVLPRRGRHRRGHRRRPGPAHPRQTGRPGGRAGHAPVALGAPAPRHHGPRLLPQGRRPPPHRIRPDLRDLPHADGRDDRGLSRPGQLPRQGGRLRRPGDRRRVRRPAQGLLRQRRRLPRGQGPPAARPLPRAGSRRGDRRRRLSRERRNGDGGGAQGPRPGRRPRRGRPGPDRRRARRRPSRRDHPRRTAVPAASPTALPPLRGLRRLPLPALRLPDPARAQRAAPQADLRRRRSRGRGLRPRTGCAVARPLRLPEQDGIRLRGKARRPRPRPPGEGHGQQKADLPPDAAARGVPDLLPRRRARLPRPARVRPGARPRGLRAGDPQGPAPPPRPPRGQADGRAHGPPRDDTSPGDRSRPARRASPGSRHRS